MSGLLLAVGTFGVVMLLSYLPEMRASRRWRLDEAKRERQHILEASVEDLADEIEARRPTPGKPTP